MRKWIMLVALLLLAGAAIGQEGLPSAGQQDNLSLKAGPTEPGEGLSLVWVEAMVYPKVVRDEKVVSLGVRTASRVREVKAFFDFTSEKVSLSSSDGMFWSNVYRLPSKLANGVHVVRYQISGARGSVQRTVEFYLNPPVQMAKAAPAAPRSAAAASVSSWPITVTSTCAALSGTASRIVQSGQRLTAISRVAWYKVVFDDGQEGWISSTRVKEPTEDYYNAGYKAYLAKDYAAAIRNYQNAVTVDPDFVKGHLWLAKSYYARGDLDDAADSLIKALKVDDRDIESRVMAATVAQKYYNEGHAKARAGRNQEAIAAFRKSLELKSSSVAAWIELGQTLSKVGFEAEARDAWREALKYDPENRELHALLKTNYRPAVAQKSAAPADTAVAPVLSRDSLKIVMDERTRKGTAISRAIKSVVAMTRSLGTPIIEKGWQIKKEGEKFLVSYLCEQSGGALESFDWLVDVDTRQVLPHNDNARLLMSRW